MPAETKFDSFDAYLADQSWSCGDIEDLIQSPRLLRGRRTGAIPPADGPALTFGTYVHMLLLEPDKAIGNVVEGPKNPKTGRCYGKTTKAWEEFVAEHPGKLVIDEKDSELAARMVEAFWNGGCFAARYLSLEGPVEQSIYWTDPGTGLRLRIRPDKRVMGHFCLDLKSTKDSASPWSFAYTAAKRRYALRSAFYRRGIEALTGEPGRVAYIALPKEEPFEDIAWHEIHDDDVDAADRVLGRSLDELARRIESDDWTPTWVTQPNVIRLPGYASAEQQWAVPESE